MQPKGIESGSRFGGKTNVVLFRFKALVCAGIHSNRRHEVAKQVENRKDQKMKATRTRRLTALALLLCVVAACPNTRAARAQAQSDDAALSKQETMASSQDKPEAKPADRSRKNQRRKKTKPLPAPVRKPFRKPHKTRSRVSSAFLSRTTIIFQLVPATEHRTF